jgi:hypothetical protein
MVLFCYAWDLEIYTHNGIHVQVTMELKQDLNVLRQLA